MNSLIENGFCRKKNCFGEPYWQVHKVVSFLFSGSQIIQALENSVSQYPKLEGRFAQIAGCSYAFDPTAPTGSRIDPTLVKIQGEYIEMDRVGTFIVLINIIVC